MNHDSWKGEKAGDPADFEADDCAEVECGAKRGNKVQEICVSFSKAAVWVALAEGKKDVQKRLQKGFRSTFRAEELQRHIREVYDCEG